MNARYSSMTAKAIEHERARSFMKAADCWAKASREARNELNVAWCQARHDDCKKKASRRNNG
jgi:hypothetical protein